MWELSDSQLPRIPFPWAESDLADLVETKSSCELVNYEYPDLRPSGKIGRMTEATFGHLTKD